MVNNWFGFKDLLDDDCYIEKNIFILVVNGSKVFLEYVFMCYYVVDEFECVY